MKKYILFSCLVCLAAGAFAKTAVIYHTSDSHGFFYPKNGQGGFAALAAVLKQEKNPYLLLDAGDFAEGTMETKTSKGIKAVQLINKLGYDAVTLGNHEFAYYDEGLENILAQAKFPFLAANFVKKDTGAYPPHILPYKIFLLGEMKVAVIGLANANPTRPVRNYIFTDPLAALEQVLEKPDVQQADAVVVLVHDSVADDKPEAPFYVGEIGRKLDGRVQVVLGGHAHKTISDYLINQVLFVEPGANLQAVGKITLQTDDNTGKLQAVSAQMIPLIIAQTGQDEKIAAYAESLREPGIDEVLGQAAETLTLPDTQSTVKDGRAENWIADVARAYSGAEVFVHNSAGVRTALEQGPVTKRDLLDMFPFDDKIVTMTVTGEFLTQLVRTSLYPRNLLAFSGLTVSYHLDKKNQIKKLRIWVQGKKIKNNKLYRLATNSYLAKGGSEGKLFLQIPAEQKTLVGNKTIRELLAETFQQGPVHAPATGRVVLLP